MKHEKNSRFWSYNLPLQVWPSDHEEDCRILNYMARKEGCTELHLDNVLGEETREEFFEHAACVLENLASLFRKAAKDPKMTIYYPDTDPEAREAE